MKINTRKGMMSKTDSGMWKTQPYDPLYRKTADCNKKANSSLMKFSIYGAPLAGTLVHWREILNTYSISKLSPNLKIICEGLLLTYVRNQVL